MDSGYYSFGMLLSGRHFDSDRYRYGFNGKEKDDEMEGEGNWQDYGNRMYSPRLGRFASVDPYYPSYPWNSTYAFSENDVISSIDKDGLEKKKKSKCEMGCDDMFSKKGSDDNQPKLKQPKAQDHDDKMKYAMYKLNPTLKDKDGKDKKPGQLLIIVKSNENFEDNYDPKKTQTDYGNTVQYPNLDYAPGADKNTKGDDDKRMDEFVAPVEITIYDSKNLGFIKIIINNMDQLNYIRENFKTFEGDILKSIQPNLNKAHIDADAADKTFSEEMDQYNDSWKKYHRQQNIHSLLKKVGIKKDNPEKPDLRRPTRQRSVTPSAL
jgi:RHS repeat-associated protein